MAQSVLVGIGPGELALVEGERPAVAVDQAAESALAIVNGESGAVVVDGEQVASMAMIASDQPIAAITNAQSTNVSLIDNDPSMAAVGVPSRTMVAVANTVKTSLVNLQITEVTPLLVANQAHDFTIQAGPSFQLLSFTASTPAWVRIYGTSAARAADTRTQPGGSLPLAGTGFYTELATVATPETITLSPVPTVQSTAGLAYARVVNRDSVSRSITLSFSTLLLEA